MFELGSLDLSASHHSLTLVSRVITWPCHVTKSRESLWHWEEDTWRHLKTLDISSDVFETKSIELTRSAICLPGSSCTGSFQMFLRTSSKLSLWEGPASCSMIDHLSNKEDLRESSCMISYCDVCPFHPISSHFNVKHTILGENHSRCRMSAVSAVLSGHCELASDEKSPFSLLGSSEANRGPARHTSELSNKTLFK